MRHEHGQLSGIRPEIRERDDVENARVLTRVGDVDTHDAGVGVWAPEERRADHARQPHIGDEKAVATQQPRIFAAPYALADVARRRGFSHSALAYGFYSPYARARIRDNPDDRPSSRRRRAQ
jgi:hypothetical protein